MKVDIYNPNPWPMRIETETPREVINISAHPITIGYADGTSDVLQPGETIKVWPRKDGKRDRYERQQGGDAEMTGECKACMVLKPPSSADEGFLAGLAVGMLAGVTLNGQQASEAAARMLCDRHQRSLAKYMSLVNGIVRERQP